MKNKTDSRIMYILIATPKCSCAFYIKKLFMHLFACRMKIKIDSKIMYMPYSYIRIGRQLKCISIPKFPYESILGRNYQGMLRLKANLVQD